MREIVKLIFNEVTEDDPHVTVVGPTKLLKKKDLTGSGLVEVVTTGKFTKISNSLGIEAVVYAEPHHGELSWDDIDDNFADKLTKCMFDKFDGMLLSVDKTIGVIDEMPRDSLDDIESAYHSLYEIQGFLCQVIHNAPPETLKRHMVEFVATFDELTKIKTSLDADLELLQTIPERAFSLCRQLDVFSRRFKLKQQHE